jgi:hypothetical protein
VTAEVQFSSRDSQCEFCCGQSGTGTCYSPVHASSPGSIIPPMFDLIIHLYLHAVLPEVQMDEAGYHPKEMLYLKSRSVEKKLLVLSL